MRTLSFLLAGLLILAAFVLLARLFSANYPAAMTWATTIFVTLWFGIAAFNMWIGIDQAGYSFGEELPIFLLIFGVPAALSAFLRWKVL
ncbi:hypothetical protein [Herminiimonas arsenitoxidans]|uniref:hypothetical protein n=1 Tax=Herminiimonas arsenitoxidans TaxID=1809410 RepID=UPI000970B9C8|nr:hypothetical protein [Herminiimonas arsenitoxidans]